MPSMHHKFIITMALPLLAACATTSICQKSAHTETISEPPLAIIDAHTHTRFEGKPERTSGIPVTKEQYLKEMREAGVVGAVSHTGQKDEGYVDLKENNVIHCAGVGARPDLRKLDQGLSSKKYGCVKIYLGYVHQWANDPRYKPIYQIAEKYDVPVVFHTGDTYSTKAKLKFADPLTIDEVAVDHPNVNFVIAHCGNPWIESAAEVAYKNPNVYLDVSAFLIGDLTKSRKETVEDYVIKPVTWIFGFVEDPSKFMFGTDWPLTDMKSYIAAIKRAVPKEHWQAVFHDNAAKVFKFPTRQPQ
jgi:uncharacterized protein